MCFFYLSIVKLIDTDVNNFTIYSFFSKVSNSEAIRGISDKLFQKRDRKGKDYKPPDRFGDPVFSELPKSSSRAWRLNKGVISFTVDPIWRV
jgi:hypothetical protein